MHKKGGNASCMKSVRSERVNDSEGVGRENENERGKKKHKGWCGERDCCSHRAALAMEYAGLLQPRGVWVNRESTVGLAWFALWLT